MIGKIERQDSHHIIALSDPKPRNAVEYEARRYFLFVVSGCWLYVVIRTFCIVSVLRPAV